jgi:prophage regulatory protein
MAKQLLDRILRPREVTEFTGLSRTTIWRAVKAGTFPKPVRLTPSTIGWCQTDLAHWIAERRAAAGLPEDEQSTIPRKQVPAEQSLGAESDRVTRPPRKGMPP